MPKKNIVLADCETEKVVSFGEGLSAGALHFEIESHIANWKRTGKWSELKRYGMYFWVAFRYFLKRREYRVLVGWQQFYALIFCFYCSVFHVKKTVDIVAANFTYKPKKGKAARIYRWFMQKCLNETYLDYIHVPSENYADAVSREFGFPRERVIVAPFGVNDPYCAYSQLDVPQGYTKDGYALAIGRSNRDYDFLIRAWESIDYPLVIISDTYTGTTSQKNIAILRNVAGTAYHPWVAHCNVMVIPIDDGTICSGDTVLLTAMAMKRRIVVTAPSTLAEMYITDGENAILVEKNAEQFQHVMKELLFSHKYDALGEGARESFLQQFTRDAMAARFLAHMNGDSADL